jgi:hypothetical protein
MRQLPQPLRLWLHVKSKCFSLHFSQRAGAVAMQPLERSGWRVWGWRLDNGGITLADLVLAGADPDRSRPAQGALAATTVARGPAIGSDQYPIIAYLRLLIGPGA